MPKPEPVRTGPLIRLRTRLNGYERWLPSYLLQLARRRRPRGPVHVLFGIADHYEPKGGGASLQRARDRVGRWLTDYPRNLGGFRDADGRPPRHSFFYPAEEYEPELLDDLAGLCRDGFGEVEVHLHHDRDTAENLRRTLLDFKTTLHERHGFLPRDPKTGEIVYAFVHGNWALDNSRPDGCWCGINNELDILHETGCYADFTMPSAPHPTQTPTINSIYYATDDPHRTRSHDRGVIAGTAPPPPRSILMIQGPLVLNWRRRKWGLVPRIESGAVQINWDATAERIDLWLSAHVHVPRRPDWCFVKLHAHGAHETSFEPLLGEPMVRFHEAMAERARRDSDFHFHYVTAREMYNLARAAEDGWTGPVDEARDYLLTWNPAGATRATVQG